MTQRINLPEKFFKSNLIDDNEDHGFYKEIINTNTIDTDRIFTKGKPIEGKKLGFIQHKKGNKRKSK